MDNHYVNTVARQSGSNFYYSFFSLPKEKREAITAVYAFCREVDDAVDDPNEKDPAGQVARWRAEIANTYDGKPTLPLTRSLMEAIDRFSLTRAYFDGILDGVAMDLSRKRYATFEELSVYCGHVAGEVGLLCVEIFGYRSERLQSYARKLGLAFQLTNILRDVGDDANQGRNYLPHEDLKRFGVEEEWILKKASPSPNAVPLPKGEGGRRSDPGEAHFQRLMAFETRRARDVYREAAVLPTAEERPSLRAAEIMRAVYEEILNRVEKRHYQVFGDRIRVPTPLKVWLAFKTYWEYR